MTIAELIELLEKAEGPDRELDRLISAYDPGPKPEISSWAYTSSIDRAVALCNRALPGWGWRVATCCVSDDAWVFPDFNSLEHGDSLKREFRQDIDWTDVTDVDLRPAGRPAVALCIAILKAKRTAEAAEVA